MYFQKALIWDMSFDMATDDDPKTLHLTFQAVSISLQLSQSTNSNLSVTPLLIPLLERDQEMLQALVKLCINTPYTKEKLKWGLQSNGLYILATCFNPGLLHYNLSLIHI